MIGIRGIVFDCDGVLFESKRANLAYYNAILEVFDEPPVTEDEPEKAHLCHTAASSHVLMQLLGEERAPEALSMAVELDYRQCSSFHLWSPNPACRNPWPVSLQNIPWR
ncbi:MAG: hypothetical protein GTO60_17210 [Gammaproteobacteria bacterium]|nr:hypothetical protein [Gammaproteobacteria bacterium]